MALILPFLLLSQTDKGNLYFPQEQLIHPNCKQATNKNQCLKEQIFEKLNSLITSPNFQTAALVDTLEIRTSFEVDYKGRLVDGKHFTFVNDSVIRKDFGENLKNITASLPRFQVINRKPNPFVSTHSIDYSFLKQKTSEGISFIRIEKPTEPYTGGVIDEIPIFPGCGSSAGKEARDCFLKKMQDHIKNNFRYPEEAVKNKLQGKVNIMFIIDKSGLLSDIKVRGPHEILEAETVRIIKLLPQFEPARKNGTPVRTPFAIPLTFKLP